jgi:hypothetical protein
MQPRTELGQVDRRGEGVGSAEGYCGGRSIRVACRKDYYAGRRYLRRHLRGQQVAQRPCRAIVQGYEDGFDIRIGGRILTFNQLKAGTGERPLQATRACRRVTGKEHPGPGKRLR